MGDKIEFEKIEKIYHFTSLETALLILENKSLRFGRLNNMNDMHEFDKLVFVDSNGAKLNTIPSDICDKIQEDIYKYRQISFTVDDKSTGKLGFDLHQMWGLYANKGEGVCLVFDKKELVKNFDDDIIQDRVSYDENVESFYVYCSGDPNKITDVILEDNYKLFFHKRKEWEHEQEYRLLKKCLVSTREEYLNFGSALKFIILTSKWQDVDNVRYLKDIKTIKSKAGEIPVLIYGNGLLDYSLITSNAENTIWTAQNGYEPIMGENCVIDV